MPTKKETHTKNLQKGKQRGEAAGGKSGGPKVSPLPKSASARANAMKKKNMAYQKYHQINLENQVMVKNLEVFNQI